MPKRIKRYGFRRRTSLPSPPLPSSPPDPWEEWAYDPWSESWATEAEQAWESMGGDETVPDLDDEETASLPTTPDPLPPEAWLASFGESSTSSASNSG